MMCAAASDLAVGGANWHDTSFAFLTYSGSDYKGIEPGSYPAAMIAASMTACKHSRATHYALVERGGAPAPEFLFWRRRAMKSPYDARRGLLGGTASLRTSRLILM